MKRVNKSLRNQAAYIALAALVVGCEGPPPEITYGDTTVASPAVAFQDRNYIDPGAIEGGTSNLNGAVKNYLTQEYVGGVTVTATGVTPPVEVTGDANAAYTMDVPVGSVFWVKTYKTGYKYTYDVADLTQVAAQYTKNLYITSATDIDGLAAAFGKTQNPSCGIILATMKNQADVAQAGVNGVTLSNADAEGPYYLDAANAGAVGATETSASGRMIWFNVCDPGVLTATNGRLVGVSAAGAYYAAPKSVQIYQNGVTVVTIKVTQGGTPPPPPPDVNIIDFPGEIMPIFAKYGCSGCHAADGTAAATGLYFNANPEAVYYELSTRAQVVNIANPSQSYLLTKPLLEEPPNHPNASFEDTYNTDYVAILQWIEQGAPYGVNPPPPVEVEYDFAYDIYPIFAARGCTACHTGAGGGGLDLSLDAATVYANVMAAEIIDYTYNDRSSLLRNPYCGPDYCANDQYPEAHPTRVFYTTDDPDYVKMYTWIGQLDPVIVVDPIFDPYTNVNFVAQRHRLAVLGCVRCHSKEDYANAGNLKLAGTAYEVYQSLTDEVNNPNAIVEYDYAASNFMTKPNAYYTAVNHTGGKQVADLADPYARYMGGWIEEGAQFVAPLPIDFATQVAPLFGANSLNCQGCHNIADPDGGLALDGTPQQIFDALAGRVVATYPAQSAVLTKSCGGYLYNGADKCIYDRNINHAGPRRNIAQYYNEFQVLADWISEGALFTPQ
jgi:hypothetical protein